MDWLDGCGCPGSTNQRSLTIEYPILASQIAGLPAGYHGPAAHSAWPGSVAAKQQVGASRASVISASLRPDFRTSCELCSHELCSSVAGDCRPRGGGFANFI